MNLYEASADVLKKISLGTAQFGMDYGVTNQHGKTPYKEIEKILVEASQIGISYLDTASFYGDSEKILGKCISDNQLYFNVTSKIKIDDNTNNLEQLITASLENLKINKLDSFLFHQASYQLDKKMESSFKALIALKEKGYVNKIGASVYRPEEVFDILEKVEIDVIQLPLNVFDHRFIDSGCIQKLTEHKVEIQARSIFLQGVLLNPITMLPEYFHQFAKQFKKYHDLAKEKNMSLMEVALSLCFVNQGISQYLLGCATYKEFKENISIIKNQPYLEASEISRLSTYDEKLIEPVLWY